MDVSFFDDSLFCITRLYVRGFYYRNRLRTREPSAEDQKAEIIYRLQYSSNHFLGDHTHYKRRVWVWGRDG